MKTIADDFSSNSQSGKDPLSLAWTNPWFVGKGIVVHHREKCFCFEFQEVNTYRVPHRLTIRFVSFPIQDHQTASLTLSLHFVIPWWPWRISSIISDCKALGWESTPQRDPIESNGIQITKITWVSAWLRRPTINCEFHGFSYHQIFVYCSIIFFVTSWQRTFPESVGDAIFRSVSSFSLTLHTPIVLGPCSKVAYWNNVGLILLSNITLPKISNIWFKTYPHYLMSFQYNPFAHAIDWILLIFVMQ